MQKQLLGCAVLFLLTSCAHGRTSTVEMSRQAPVPMPADGLQWADLDPVGAPGARIAMLWGNVASGRFGAFFKLPAGFAAPLHTHTHPMKVVIVSGMYIQGPEGAAEFRLGPGSYLMQPGDNYRHTTRCDSGSDCVFFVESEGAFDLHAVTGTAPQSN